MAWGNILIFAALLLCNFATIAGLFENKRRYYLLEYGRITATCVFLAYFFEKNSFPEFLNGLNYAFMAVSLIWLISFRKYFPF
ncbi:MAG: hypothetical protein HC817_04030 [Saprospiraceae bacterium]|nr:hypothetical protein [Saprospiraceae bacterium]